MKLKHHWTQRPENRARMLKQLKRASAIKNRKVLEPPSKDAPAPKAKPQPNGLIVAKRLYFANGVGFSTRKAAKDHLDACHIAQELTSEKEGQTFGRALVFLEKALRSGRIKAVK